MAIARNRPGGTVTGPIGPTGVPGPMPVVGMFAKKGYGSHFEIESRFAHRRERSYQLTSSILETFKCFLYSEKQRSITLHSRYKDSDWELMYGKDVLSSDEAVESKSEALLIDGLVATQIRNQAPILKDICTIEIHPCTWLHPWLRVTATVVDEYLKSDDGCDLWLEEKFMKQLEAESIESLLVSDNPLFRRLAKIFADKNQP